MLIPASRRFGAGISLILAAVLAALYVLWLGPTPAPAQTPLAGLLGEAARGGVLYLALATGALALLLMGVHPAPDRRDGLRFA